MEDRTGDVVRRQQLLDLANTARLYEKEAKSDVEGPEIKIVFVPEEEDEEWDKVMEEAKSGDKCQETIQVETADDIELVDLDFSSDDEAEDADNNGKLAAKETDTRTDNEDEDMEDDRDLITTLKSEISLIQQRLREHNSTNMEDDIGTPMSIVKDSGGMIASATNLSDGSTGTCKTGGDNQSSKKKATTEGTQQLVKKTPSKNSKKAAKKSPPLNSKKTQVRKSPSHKAKAQSKTTVTAGSKGNLDNEEDDDYVNDVEADEGEADEDDGLQQDEEDTSLVGKVKTKSVSDKYLQKWVNK